jgi:hypothetical protein
MSDMLTSPHLLVEMHSQRYIDTTGIYDAAKRSL